MEINLDKFGKVKMHNYINLTPDDKSIVLDMRNHPDIKIWMHNQSNISKKSHFDFIRGLKSDTTRCYFLIKQQQQILGSINFSNISQYNNFVEFGLYANPFQSLKGSGRLLEAVATYYAYDKIGVQKLNIEVYSDNERAINFYNKCGFKLIKIKNINNKKIFCMEKKKYLNNENEKNY
jgi:UDP-4-amino-4,6-dideoxy-N-acetyl-beta-L-altrosamine N-acetyltransferase